MIFHWRSDCIAIKWSIRKYIFFKITIIFDYNSESIFHWSPHTLHPFEGNFNDIPKSEYCNEGIAFTVIWNYPYYLINQTSLAYHRKRAEKNVHKAILKSIKVSLSLFDLERSSPVFGSPSCIVWYSYYNSLSMEEQCSFVS